MPNLPPSRRQWRRVEEHQPDGRKVVVSCLPPYRVWEDRDVECGQFACSMQTGPFEHILGHAPTREAAKRHADAAELDS